MQNAMNELGPNTNISLNKMLGKSIPKPEHYIPEGKILDKLRIMLDKLPEITQIQGVVIIKTKNGSTKQLQFSYK